MLTFKTMKWSNAFSYAGNNSINFSSNQLVQLVGKNGHGKSSIGLILEEVLYNKNSKGIKKANILNRYTKAKQYTIELEFTKDADTYNVITNRGVTQTVKLLKNGEDISSHTSTNTYKMIEEIIGFDNKTFSQIVYQSNAFSLEFLTATDTGRKKFLIDLLNLSKYSKAGEYFKDLTKEVSKDLEVVNAKLGTVNTWLKRTSKEDTTKQDLVPVPETDKESADALEAVDKQILNIEATNKKIAQNNKYKDIRDSIKFDILEKPMHDLVQLKVEYNEAVNRLQNIKNVISGTKAIDTCPTCGQPIDTTHTKNMLDEAKEALPLAEQVAKQRYATLTTATAEVEKFNKNASNQLEWEKYHSLYDSSMSASLLDIEELTANKARLKKKVDNNAALIKTATDKNVAITAHNTKVDVLLSQISGMTEDSAKFEAETKELNSRLTTLQILTKTFSPSGLVAYKIEVLVKDLENMTNEYLQDMSDGRFQLAFKISASDKLDVVITDNGKDIDIFALSNGELARVNVSTLLAIRKLMQSLSNTRINLLILDETIESLDVDGKEKLVEVLLKEESLDTILISHGFSHPLLEKVHIIKENNISRIE